MIWKLFSLGYRFHFLVETQEKMARIRIRETLSILSHMENPRNYDGFVACKNDEWCVIRVKNTDNLLIGIIIHETDDPIEDLRHSIELVDIIDLRLLH